ncbi:DegT/DnrJ/EryC1/StrS family aminotransferase, partial [Candidatus Curtissbacteria bacterium]|nr:DegT/DnrJ/EryC1/StrS family aminotransferase [Candidatus Curtissbacteria bacterium]
DDDIQDRKKLFNIVDRRFSFIHLGHSFRLTEIEAALGLPQLKDSGKIIKKRQINAARLTKGLAKWSAFIQTPKIRPGSTHAFMLYPIVILNKKVNRNKLIEYLEIRGIETRYLMPLLNQPVYKKLFGNIEKDFPVAKFLNQNGFIIGCHQDLKTSEIDLIVETFNKFFEGL